jgi:flagellar assembly protein FliH
MPIETLTKPKQPDNARPFLFDRSFDRGQSVRKQVVAKQADAKSASAEELPALPAEPEAPPPPTFSEEEMEAARAAAREEGRLAGLEEARVADEARAAALLEEIGRGLERLGQAEDARRRDTEAGSLELLREAVARLLPAYTEAHGAKEIEAVVRDALDLMLSAEAVTLRLPAAQVETLTPRIEETARHAGFEGRIRILPDPALGPSDVSVDWGDGEASRRFDQAMQHLTHSLDAAIARLGQQDGGPHDGAAPDDEKEAG